jgi:hypothetical protein
MVHRYEFLSVKYMISSIIFSVHEINQDTKQDIFQQLKESCAEIFSAIGATFAGGS